MMKFTQAICLLVCAGFLWFTSCNLIDTTSPGRNGKVDIYLLKNYNTPPNSRQIIESSAVIEDEPLVKYEEIILYNSTDHTFKLMDSARSKINKLENSGHGLAFAVTVNDTVIYTGYFWASFSSASLDWVVIDPLSLHGSEMMQVRLGYPGLLPGYNIPDRRNDPRIIQVFNDDHKLKE